MKTISDLSQIYHIYCNGVAYLMMISNIRENKHGPHQLVFYLTSKSTLYLLYWYSAHARALTLMT